ncbi:hypothetical protein [Huaxiibacter chinensis]|uniref:hypothetical protein n=1 Tax=Huaxiibacter chinensis TaxID=2899785 RepID=UPI003D31D7BF
MTAFIAASYIFPSGPKLALDDIAHRLNFPLIHIHPEWTYKCQFSIKAIVPTTPEERFRQLFRQALTKLLGTGLRKAAFHALEVSAVTSVHHIVSDVNGESYREDELGYNLLALTAWRLRSSDPAGDTLLLSSSDDGQRGAIVMSKEGGSRTC